MDVDVREWLAARPNMVRLVISERDAAIQHIELAMRHRNMESEGPDLARKWVGTIEADARRLGFRAGVMAGALAVALLALVVR